MDLSFPIEKSHPLFDATLIRIDLTSSNYMIQREKEALDILIRGSVQLPIQTIGTFTESTPIHR